MLYDGKQLKAASVTLAKLASDVTAVFAGFVKADGTTPITGALNLNGQRLYGLPAPTTDTDAARLADLYAVPWKDKCQYATTGNISLTGLQNIDGGTGVANQRVLVWKQSTASQNGIYLQQSTAWVRAPDADSATELRGAVVSIEQGTVNADKRFAQTADNITLETTSIVWVDIGSGGPSYATSSNKGMTASATSADNQVACATPITASPGGHGYVRVLVNGMGQILGDGVKTKDCYFSGDTGTTARAINAITANDVLYWVGSVAGFQLATGDIVDFDYAV